MSLESTAHRSLLVINTRAGNGRAAGLANEITANHNLQTIDISDFFSLEQAQRDELLATFSHIFVLGGDGSAFSLLNFLVSQNLQNKITVVPLGLGGENVLAKDIGSYGKSVLTVSQVLTGDYSSEQVNPFTVQLQNEAKKLESLPFLWSVHAGFSAAVLSEIEFLRKSNATDFQRRYGATMKRFLRLRRSEQVMVSGTGIQPRQVLDFGVVSASLPYWTSKFRLPVTTGQTAILHTIEGSDRLQAEPVVFSARFSLELISLKLGLPIPREIVKHQALGADFSVHATTQSKVVGVDSEIYPAVSALVTNSTINAYSRNVFLGRV